MPNSIGDILTYNQNLTQTLLNYGILFIALVMSLVAGDVRFIIVLCVGIFVQLYLCSAIMDCVGISIIYCFLFGFLIKLYADHGYILMSFILVVTVFLELAIVYFFMDNVNGIPWDFIQNHVLFLIVGSLFTFIPTKIIHYK